MPIVAASNGIRPEIRALGVIELNKPVTPTEINTHVGTGNYAAKYITFLRRLGFVIESNKDGRRVVSYTLIAEPENVAEIRATKPKVRAEKPKKATSTKTKVDTEVETTKTEVVEENVPENAPESIPHSVPSSFSVDEDWDSLGDVAELIR
jgi:hypothetical protein